MSPSTRTSLLALISLLCAGGSATAWWLGTRDHRDTRVDAAKASVADVEVSAARITDLRRALSGSERKNALLGLLQQTADEDPVRAVQLAATLTPEEGRDDALQACLLRLIASDPEGAGTWVDEVDDTLPTEVVTQLAHAWAEHAPRAALRWASQLSDAAMRRAALAAIQTRAHPFARAPAP